MLSTWKRFRNHQCWGADGCTPARAPCKVCPTGGFIPSSLQESHNKIIIYYPETSPRRNIEDRKGGECRAGKSQVGHSQLITTSACSVPSPAPGLGNTAAHVWKGLNPLSRAEPINGLFCPGKKCYLFSLALKGVKNQDCDHNRDQPMAYAHQCLQLTFWEFIIAAKGWKMKRTPQKQSSCHEFLKVSSSPGPEAVMSSAQLPGLRAKSECLFFGLHLL